MNRPSTIKRRKPTEVARACGVFLLLLSAWGQARPAAAQPTGLVESHGSRSQLYAELAEEAELVGRYLGLVKRVVQVVEPTIVHIEARKMPQRAGHWSAPQRGRDSEIELNSEIVEEAGSGVIFEYRNRFFILTNRHVVAGAQPDHIRVTLSDGRFFNPLEVRADADSDLAVLVIGRPTADVPALESGESIATSASDAGDSRGASAVGESGEWSAARSLAAARFGDSDQVQIGDFVVAVGSPFGLSHSVSFGIISAKGRTQLELGSRDVRYQDFLQTDAAVNPGNSGGPLMNLRGEVIGINTAIASNSGGSDGIGFAIPVNMAQAIARDLIDHGRPRRGFLGVTLDSRFSPQDALAAGLPRAIGARVTAITPGSPAASVDIQPGDIVVSFNGVEVRNDSHLVTQVSTTQIGRVVPLDIIRQGERRTLQVAIADREPFE